MATFLTIVVNVMSGYAFAKYHFKGDKILFGIVLATLMVPLEVIMIPIFKVIVATHLYNNLWGLIIPAVASPTAVFLVLSLIHILLPLVGFASRIGIMNPQGLIFMYMGFGSSMSIVMFHSFIKNIPEELEEAATIDGCGSFRLFFSIVIPLMRTILITVAVLNVMWIWNDYLLPSLIINKPGWQTLPLKTYLFFGQFAKRWDLASAGLIMCIIPIIIFYLCCQKYIVKGITDGAIK